MLLTAELFQGYHRLVEFLILVDDDLLVFAFTNDETSVTPTEFVHTPEGIHRQEETINRISENKTTFRPYTETCTHGTYERM